MILLGEIGAFSKTDIEQGRAKVAWSYLSIGYYDDPTDLYLLHQTEENPAGVKYKIIGNLRGTFVKYNYKLGSNEIRLSFKNPRHHIVIFSDVDRLKEFNYILKKGLQEEELDSEIDEYTNLYNVPEKFEVQDKVAPKIWRMSHIPTVKENAEFIRELTVYRPMFPHIQDSVCNLKNLNVLYLEGNYLETLPSEISLLPLREMRLCGNLLGRTPIEDWLLSGNLQRTLAYLDLSRNDIRQLPSDIHWLKRLTTLLLQDNLLKNLPLNFGRLKKLKMLNLSSNKLCVLPASFRFLKLDFLHVYKNSWRTPFSKNKIEWPEVPPTLVRMCMDVILMNQLDYSSILPPQIVNQFEYHSSNYCFCGRPTYPCTPENEIRFNVETVTSEVCWMGQDPRESNIHIEVRYCSDRCRKISRRRSLHYKEQCLHGPDCSILRSTDITF